MKILLETSEEEKAMRVPEIHLAGLVEAIKTNELDERFEVLVLNSSDVTKCEHEHVIKAISIPMTDNGRGELDYDELLKIVQKIVSKDTDPRFTWFEVLACIDCDTVLEQMDVFIPEPDSASSST